MPERCEFCGSILPSYDETCKKCAVFYKQDLEKGIIAPGVLMKNFTFGAWKTARLAERQGLSPQEAAGRAKDYDEENRRITESRRRQEDEARRQEEEFRRRHGYD